MLGSSYKQREVADDLTERDRRIREIKDQAKADRSTGRTPSCPTLEDYD